MTPEERKIDEILIKNHQKFCEYGCKDEEILEDCEKAKASLLQMLDLARLEGAEGFHKRIFNHFNLLPKIQRRIGSHFTQVFNEENYQKVACDYLAQLSPKEKES